ncbi:MAG: hypothetical protein V8Q07_05655 [Acutalibacteraceae bacterium]
MGVKKRVNIADYIDTTPNTETATYALMGTGFKTLDENPSAQTKSKKYVCDSSATKSIASYDDFSPSRLTKSENNLPLSLFAVLANSARPVVTQKLLM